MLKMIRGICAPLLLMVLTGQAFVQTAKPPKILLIETGELFSNQLELKKVNNGEKWLGLYVTKTGSSLIESKVTAKPVFDEETKKEAVGKIISVDQTGKPVFLLKGATKLKPGLATTIYKGDGESARDVVVDTEKLAQRKPRQLKLGDQEYQLKVLSSKSRSSEPCPRCLDVKLTLVLGQQTQTIYKDSFSTEEGSLTWRLLWAGDIDGDGKLDLYMDFTTEGVGGHRELFLSSQAKPGQLVESAATFVSDPS